MPISPQVIAAIADEWMQAAMHVTHLVAVVGALYASNNYWNQPYHTSKLSGQGWVDELIQGHPDRIYSELGVRLHVFVQLNIKLRELGYRDSQYITLEEQLAIFLYACVTGLSVQHLGERFQHSNETIAKYFRLMCNAFTSPAFYNEYVCLPSTEDPPAHYLSCNPKLWPYFQKCLGVMDGSHIACTPSAEDHANSQNRRGFLSQNILAVCSFSMHFLYVLTGWEGSVTDSFLFEDARFTDLHIPPGYFYLGDAGFPICKTVLTPYHGVRYHLNEWARATTKPRNKEELFNLRHAQARNVIEHIFGVIKKRWIILVLPPKYDMDLQARIPAALAALHNFILDKDPLEHIAADIYDPAPGVHLDPTDLSVTRRTGAESEAGWKLREEIAQNMWDDYIVIREQRSLAEELEIDGENQDIDSDMDE